jgi:hypothetical protein
MNPSDSVRMNKITDLASLAIRRNLYVRKKES